MKLILLRLKYDKYIAKLIIFISVGQNYLFRYCVFNTDSIWWFIIDIWPLYDVYLIFEVFEHSTQTVLCTLGYNVVDIHSGENL